MMSDIDALLLIFITHFLARAIKDVTPTIHTYTVEGPNTRTRGRKGALTSDHKIRKTIPIHEPTKQTRHKTQQTLAYTT